MREESQTSKDAPQRQLMKGRQGAEEKPRGCPPFHGAVPLPRAVPSTTQPVASASLASLTLPFPFCFWRKDRPVCLQSGLLTSQSHSEG